MKIRVLDRSLAFTRPCIQRCKNPRHVRIVGFIRENGRPPRSPATVLPDAASPSWARPGIPAEIATELNHRIAATLGQPDVTERLAEIGLDVPK